MRKIEWRIYKLIGYRKYNKKKNFIHKTTYLSHPNVLNYSSYVYINEGAKFYGSGSVNIESNTIIGPNLTVYTTGHNYRSGMIPYNGEEDFVSKIHISSNVWIGGNVLILPGVSIGEGSIVGAGSVVTKDVEKGSIVAGNPAKVINRRNEDDYEEMKRKELFYYKIKLSKIYGEK